MALASGLAKNDRPCGANPQWKGGSYGNADHVQRVVRSPEVKDFGIIFLSDVDEAAVPIGADEGQLVRPVPDRVGGD